MAKPAYSERWRAPGNGRLVLREWPSSDTGDYHSKDAAEAKLSDDLEKLSRLQELLYAHDKQSLLLIFQAMDAAGKDSTIKHVMSGVNPQGCQVFSFKAPSHEELDHDYMWRYSRCLPERGRIGVFNRSYYEEVLVVRVHPEHLERQRLPLTTDQRKTIWEMRYQQINHFEKYLTDNGTVVLKFFLHVSKKTQKKRLLDRINREEKNWKFSTDDITERARWSDYMRAYEEAINATHTDGAPWYIVPADEKWHMRLVVADAICAALGALNLHFPQLTDRQKDELQRMRQVLEAEDDEKPARSGQAE